MASRSATRAERNVLFQELKPRCIALSQIALQSDGNPSNLSELRQATGQLLDILREKCQRSDGVFDEKLADYVFFPLSQVLKINQRNPGRLAELATRCLQILLKYGWKGAISVDLARQLLILLTHFAVPEATSDTPEELKVEAYTAISLLFQDMSHNHKSAASLVEVESIPALGQCLSAILDGIADGPSSEAQLESLEALQSLWHCVKDQDALSNFLPGTISALTKGLTPTNQRPRTRRTLTRGLEVLQIVLIGTVSDLRTRNFKENVDEDKKHPTLTKAWLKATSAKIKLALTNVIKLRDRSHEDVRRELGRFCITILDECHSSLSDLEGILVETSLILSSSTPEKDPGLTTLKDLATIYPSISELIKSTIYNWVTSLPRLMQSSDEESKSSMLNRLSKASQIFSDLNIDSSVLEDAISDSLRDSVTNALDSSTSRRGVQEMPETIHASLLLAKETESYQEYSSIVMNHGSQIEARKQLEILLLNVGSTSKQLKMAGEILMQSRNTSGTGRTSTFWLSFQLLKAAASNAHDMDAFLNFDISSANEQEAVLDEIYNDAVMFLSEPEYEYADWRLRAVSMEVVAHCANKFGESFRIDLVDVLYPIVQSLGSGIPHLVEHAMTTLNIMSRSCKYIHTSDMIVQNVDYLVNAVSLKLNTFDVSPQTPQVLVMMIKLSGSSLLPYLDDVVGSIFAALANYHGYPRLVDSLFSVLGEIVDKGGKYNQLHLKSGHEISHRKAPAAVPTTSDVCRLIESAKTKRGHDGADVTPEDFPREPWKSAKELLDEADAQNEYEGEESGEVEKAPPNKVYTMVQSIARLGQHYLTSQSPLLRRRLLDLITTACVALHSNENEFLPLVNDIWPVLIKRLYDEEPFVVIAAANAVAEVCKCAGDFMSTRLQTEWSELMPLMKRAQARSLAEKSGKHGRGIFSQNRQIWDSFVGLLLALVEYVRIEDVMFDDILDLLQDQIATRDDIREALSVVNPDAVWLCQLNRGELTLISSPTMGGYQFTSVE